VQIIKQTAVALIVILAFLPVSSIFADAIKVEVAKADSGFYLTRGGKPYAIKGAGLEFKELGPFTSHGGNSIRTWRTDNARQTGQELLDDAQKHGVTVALCIEIGRERHGFDYNDEAAVAAQLEYARGEVMKYKDHPALLTWIIGNEPNLNFKNPKVFDAVNDISKMIHELDKNHPTTTALAGFNAELARLIETRTPDLDFVSIQMYGDIVNLPRYIKKIGYEAPYFVTEWGSIGHWEVRKTTWGAPVEQNSSEKAANYLKSYQVAIASDPERILGSYVFYWGQKQERTPTWYGMFLEDGSETETIDVMQYIWTGAWPQNRSPQIKMFLFDSQSSSDDIVIHTGKSYSAKVNAHDPDGDELQYAWEIKRESEATQEGGDREEIPETINGLIDKPDSKSIAVTAPDHPGAYRLFVYVRDGKGHAGHANLPFLVK
jgi:hypothetical protein